MRILIIGGTRFIGPAVVLRLHHLGHTVCLFHRHPTSLKFPDSVRHLYGDRANLPDFANAFRAIAPDVVIDMVPLTGPQAQAVMDVFRGIVQRVVAISSQDVYRAFGRVNGSEPGRPDPIPLTEDSPLRTRLFPYRGETPRPNTDPRHILDDYEKILVERAVMGDPDLPGTVLRLPMVYGPRDYQHRLFEYLKRMDDGRPAILLNKQHARWRWTRDYVENTAAAIALAATHPRAAGRIYNVGERAALSTADWIGEIGKAAGWQGEVVTVPDYQLPDEMRSLAGMEQELVADTTRIRNELGFIQIVTRDEALRRTVAWERAHPPERIDPAQFNYAKEDAILAQLL